MKNDPGTNYTIVDGLDAQSRGASTYNTAAVDHALAPSASFHVSCGIWASSFVATLQHSDDDGDTDAYIDETAGAGNTISVTLTEAGEGNVHAPNPRERYSRVQVVTGGTCEFSVTNISGRLRAVSQG